MRLLVKIDNWEYRERSVSHENYLTIFESLDSSGTFFFQNEFTLTDVHRLILVGPADLNVFLSFGFKRYDRIVVKLIVELHGVGISSQGQVVSRVETLVPSLHLNQARLVVDASFAFLNYFDVTEHFAWREQ